MRRKFEERLMLWKEKYNKKPLMVVGVRQIGKTYTIENFCKNNFSNYVYINLEKQENIRNIFEKTLEPTEIIENIKVYLNISFDDEETIIFFDECQVSERFIMSLKYFCEPDINYKIICAGSLLGVKINRFNSSFPVGKIRIENMFPMDFEEFLMALNEDLLIKKIKECFKNFSKLDESLHENALNLYKQYMCIGGMPEAVINFLESNRRLSEFDNKIIENIVDMYISDMNKYTYNSYESVKIEKVYKNIPGQLAKENKKFQYSKLEKGSDKRKFQSAIEWLISSYLTYQCKSVDKIEIPLNVYEDENTFKLYLSDIGILTWMSGIRYDDIIFNSPFMYRGVITENYVAQNLISNDIVLHYWNNNNQAEIDFLIYNKDGIIPIEVKSSENNQSKSLKFYMEKYKPKYGVRLSTKNFGFDNNIKSIPLYAIFCLKDL